MNRKIAVYGDGADEAQMFKRYKEGGIQGFTTNPTLMAKAGIKNYEAFAHSILKEIRDLPISFEVFSDEFAEMEAQALKIGAWGSNVNVKIPICNTKGVSSLPLIRKLLDKGLKLNVTAILDKSQITALREILKPNDDVIVSIFAGRIADTGVDPMPIMKESVGMYRNLTNSKILWASSREALNYYQADDCGCHIITMTYELISKLSMRGKNLMELSVDTVKMFYEDAKKSGFTI
jgi:transaldolase